VPATTTTIDRGQREGLYELVRNHLGSVEDFFVALERTKDFAKAEQLAVEFAEDFRLLQDIGWGETDERERFDLTLPAVDLMELLTRLYAETGASSAATRSATRFWPSSSGARGEGDDRALRPGAVPRHGAG